MTLLNHSSYVVLIMEIETLALKAEMTGKCIFTASNVSNANEIKLRLLWQGKYSDL